MSPEPFDPLRDITFTDEVVPERFKQLQADERPTKSHAMPLPGLAAELDAARDTFLDLDADSDEWTHAGVARPTPKDHAPDLKAKLTQPGTRYGPFEVVGPLGEGAMSVVLRGVHSRTRHPVAIKVLWVDLEPFKDMSDEVASLAEATIRERFRREAIAVSKLRHPNIIEVFSFGIQCNHPFMVLEILEAGSLKQLLKKAKRLPIERAVEIGVDILSGLTCAHEGGFIHRDVKPDNLMLDDSGRVKIVDFGLVRLLDNSSPLTRAGSSLGTPLYMPPEQASGKEVDARADVYAVGATLFHLLTGGPPHKGAKNILEITALKASPAPSLTALRSEIPARLDEVVRKMLSPRPEDRYPTADAARVALLDSLPKVVDLRVTLRTGAQEHVATMPEGAILLLGRSAKRVDFAINDPSLSRCHCLIQATAQGLSIVDLNSSNGTYVGGRRITKTQALKNGEKVRLGDTPLEVSWTG